MGWVPEGAWVRLDVRRTKNMVRPSWHVPGAEERETRCGTRLRGDITWTLVKPESDICWRCCPNQPQQMSRSRAYAILAAEGLIERAR